MNQDIKTRWLEALRSGRYKQGKGSLRTTDDQYCCLGVLCDLAVQDGIVEWEPHRDEGADVYEIDGLLGSLSYEVRVWAGISDDAGRCEPVYLDIGERTIFVGDSLIQLNDQTEIPFNFEQIADVIEEQF